MSSPVNPKLVSLLWGGAERAAALSAAHGAAFEEGWSTESFAKLLSNPATKALLATYGGDRRVVGFGVVTVVDDDAEILTLGVVSEFRRGGIGGRIVDGLVRAFERSGGGRLHLEVAEDNTAARALYAKAGFTEGGRRKGYFARKDQPACDALTLVLNVKSGVQ